jgi:hypothetical protein
MKLLLTVGCAVMALALLAASQALAVEEHAFDPSLSLEGDCQKEDGVSDPSCPYAEPNLSEPTKGGPRPLENPCGVAVDRHGDIYVANSKASGLREGEGWIDIFDPSGHYLTRIENDNKICSLAVDSQGNVYVVMSGGSVGNTQGVALYTPNSYPPVVGTEYQLSPDTLFESCFTCTGVAVDPSNDHVYVSEGDSVVELESAANGNTPVIGKEAIGFGLGSNYHDVDVCGKNHDVYVSGTPAGPIAEVFSEARILVFDGADGHKKVEIDGSEEGELSSDRTPEGGLGFSGGRTGIAVDQSNCDVYVNDVTAHHVVDQFSAAGAYIGQLPAVLPPPLEPSSLYGDLAVDDPMEAGEAGYDSPNPGNVYVGSGQKASESHLFAFKPKIGGPPEVRAQGAVQISETEALLQAELNPANLDTHYYFQYTTEEDFATNGFTNAISAPANAADAGATGAFTVVSAPALGLDPGTAYRLRLVADNCHAEGAVQGDCLTLGEGKPGEKGESVGFATYSSPTVPTGCPNEGIREAQGATLLPDCRAYELVTPPDTNGRVPTMLDFGRTIFGVSFVTEPASFDGESLVFGIEGGSLPGIEGGGGFHDAFEARRGQDGWQSSFAGLTGFQSSEPSIGGFPANHGYSFFEAAGKGSLVPSGHGIGAHYVHRPGGVIDPLCSPEPSGDFEWIGCGSLGADPRASGKYISPDGGHIILETGAELGAEAIQLEPCAAPTGTSSVYDRTLDGITHCISVKPGGGSFGAGERATYVGASADGTAVAFEVGAETYVRVDLSATVEVPTPGTIFGGLSRDGNQLVYLRPNATEPLFDPAGAEIPQGEIFTMDTSTGAAAPIGSGDEAVLVSVSPDGSHLYFSSPDVLTGETNAQGENAEAGEANLYLWDGSAIHFVTTLDESDLSGREVGEVKVGGLGLWVTNSVGPNITSSAGPGSDPSRTTSGGSVFIFESRASLAPYQNGGHSEIYRYDADDGSLLCLSCNPTGTAAASDAQLQSDPPDLLATFPPVNAATHIANVTADGKAVFFQSADRLVSADHDGKSDVYEWEAQGTGGCVKADGCISLISGGQSAGDDYLYAMTPDGSDVFFLSSDLLSAPDQDKTPSVYDARTAGGFPPPPPPPGGCLGEACQPTAVAPDDPTPASAAFSGPGDRSAKAKRRCPRSKRKVRKRGKTHCVKRRKARRHRRAHKSKGTHPKGRAK